MGPAGGSTVATSLTARVRQRVSGWGLKEWRRAGLIAVLVATAAFGGLDTVDKNVTDLKAGEPFDNGRFTITVARATVLDEVRAGQRVLYPQRPDRSYLGLVADVRNDSTLPGQVSNAVQLPDRPEATALPTMRFADGTPAVRLGPGLADRLVLLWELPRAELRPGAELSVRIWNEVPKLNATVGQGWVPSRTKYGRLTVPVGGSA